MMLSFKIDYLNAMRDQNPVMFNELRRSGALDAYADEKTSEAQALFKQLANGEPTLPDSGVLRSPAREAEIREQVYALMMDFPSNDA